MLPKAFGIISSHKTLVPMCHFSALYFNVNLDISVALSMMFSYQSTPTTQIYKKKAKP
jgi:hypothetical protein